MIEEQKIIMDAFLAGKNDVGDRYFVEKILPDLVERIKNLE